MEKKKVLYYSAAFKQRAVSEVKSGSSLNSVSTRYGIGGSTTLLKWCRQFGVELPEKEYIDLPLEEMLADRQIAVKADKSLADRVKLLEAELLLYKKLVEIAKRDYGIDLVKKLGTKQSGK